MDTGRAILRCSFCGKSQHEVRKLVAGPLALICDECAVRCADLVGDPAPRRRKITMSPAARKRKALRRMVKLSACAPFLLQVRDIGR